MVKQIHCRWAAMQVLRVRSLGWVDQWSWSSQVSDVVRESVNGTHESVQ